jgi:ribosome-binding factor A
MKQTRRTAQVGQSIRDALVEVLRRDLKDLSLGLVSINSVDVSPDLHFARVFVTGFKEEEAIAAVEQLQQRKGRIRSMLGQRIHLRYTPELDFRYDETAMRASRIESILQQVIPKETNDDDTTANDDESES